MITSFSGRYAFLSDWYPAIVEIYGRQYITLAHALMAAMCAHDRDRVRFTDLAAADFEEAATIAASVVIRSDWAEVGAEVYRFLLYDKFTRNAPLGDLLSVTDPAHICAVESREQAQILMELRNTLWQPPF